MLHCYRKPHFFHLKIDEIFLIFLRKNSPWSINIIGSSDLRVMRYLGWKSQMQLHSVLSLKLNSWVLYQTWEGEFFFYYISLTIQKYFFIFGIIVLMPTFVFQYWHRFTNCSIDCEIAQNLDFNEASNCESETNYNNKYKWNSESCWARVCNLDSWNQGPCISQHPRTCWRFILNRDGRKAWEAPHKSPWKDFNTSTPSSSWTTSYSFYFLFHYQPLYRISRTFKRSFYSRISSRKKRQFLQTQFEPCELRIEKITSIVLQTFLVENFKLKPNCRQIIVMQLNWNVWTERFWLRKNLGGKRRENYLSGKQLCLAYIWMERLVLLMDRGIYKPQRMRTPSYHMIAEAFVRLLWAWCSWFCAQNPLQGVDSEIEEIESTAGPW